MVLPTAVHSLVVSMGYPRHGTLMAGRERGPGKGTWAGNSAVAPQPIVYCIRLGSSLTVLTGMSQTFQFAY